MIQERLAALRREMTKHQVDVYLVRTDDFHCSEYVGDYFKCRKFITGFTGSAGTAVITQTDAGLWTDGRYFIQAASQLEGSTVDLYKMGNEGVPSIEEYLTDTMKEGQTLGFDGRTMSAKEGWELEKKLAEKGVKISCHMDLVGAIWEDRPALSCQKVWELDTKYTGQSRADKLALIRTRLEEKGADELLLTSLDDIAWLLNLRGDDVACNPVFLSYLAMSKEQTLLFAQEEAFAQDILEKLQSDGVQLRPYNDIYEYAAALPADRCVMIDSGKLNYTLVTSLDPAITLVDGDNPTELPKAIKNPVETANMALAHEKDGAAVCRFMRWLKTHVGKETITEMTAAVQLERFREMGENYIGPSFEPIISYADHAAIVHYSATPETDVALQPKGMVLADTGGQYLEGTTDITRTIVLGETTQKEKEFFTRVLRGNLNLGSVKFLYGCTGMSLDYMARSPLWEIGEDYNHGTGHGVGYCLNVHEGPNSFQYRNRPGRKTCVFEEGMITSNEPGFYLEGEFGIRHENLIVCRKDEKKPCGQFMSFETLTMVPFDLDAILPEQMTQKERDLLNAYHKQVFEKVSPYLNAEEKEWLKEATREI